MLNLSFGARKTFMLLAFAVAAMVVAVAAVSMPSSSTVHAHSAKMSCHTEQVALDEGYGVSRVGERRVCEDL